MTWYLDTLLTHFLPPPLYIYLYLFIIILHYFMLILYYVKLPTTLLVFFIFFFFLHLILLLLRFITISKRHVFGQISRLLPPPPAPPPQPHHHQCPSTWTIRKWPKTVVVVSRANHNPTTNTTSPASCRPPRPHNSIVSSRSCILMHLVDDLRLSMPHCDL